MREIDVAGLSAPPGGAPEPFVRHQLDPGTVRRAWVAAHGGVRAALWVAEIVWHDGDRMRVVHGVGPVALLAPMLAPAAASAGPVDRVSVADGAETALPPAWAQAATRRWHWMLTDVVPPRPARPAAGRPRPARRSGPAPSGLRRRRRCGRGLGRVLSVALTRAGLAMAPVVSLGVYVKNAAALRICHGLGYTTRHAFASGLVGQRGGTARSSTSADAPSR